MERVRLGIIGVGRLGRKRAEDIVSCVNNAQLMAICDVDETRVKNMAHKLNVGYYCTDYNEMFKNIELDGVVIANSSTEHCATIIAAAKAGLHIFCEKPIAITPLEIVNIKDTLKDYKKKFTIGFTRRVDPDYICMKKMIDSGDIGRPIFIKCTASEGIDDLEFFKVYAPRCGGFVFDVGIHDLDLVNWFAGSELIKLYAMGGVFGLDFFKELNDVDNYLINMQFENGIMAQITGSRNPDCEFVREIEIVGTKGSVKQRIDTVGNMIVMDNKGNYVDKGAGGIRAFLSKYNELYTKEIQNFADCITYDTVPVIGLDEGCTATIWASAIYDFLREKGTIK